MNLFRQNCYTQMQNLAEAGIPLLMLIDRRLELQKVANGPCTAYFPRGEYDNPVRAINYPTDPAKRETYMLMLALNSMEQ